MKELDKSLLQQLRRLKAPSCPSLAALGEFLDGKGPPEERQTLELHLRSCPSCLNHLIELQELAYLAKAGEEPPRAVVEAVKQMILAETGQLGHAQASARQRARLAVTTTWETVREWAAPRFFGKVVAAVAVAVIVIAVGTRVFQPQPSLPPTGGETILSATALSETEQNLLSTLLAVSPTLDPWAQKVASILESVPATAVVNPPAEKTRGSTDITVYQKAASATVLVVTDRGQGSGMVINDQGEVLTNWHVIQGAKRIVVVFKPAASIDLKKELAFAAIPTKTDPTFDLALLQLQAHPPTLSVLPLGDISQLQVGQDVHAIGHPKGEVWTYTTGIISQIRPEYQWKDGNLLHQATVIQTQTALNPGNSGGPLLNDQGEIIGVNAFRKEGEGLNYAVAADVIKTFLAEAPTVPSPTTSSVAPSAYRIELVGKQIVGLYLDARVPPPDVWLVYRDATRTQLAYAVRGHAGVTPIDTVIQATQGSPSLTFYFDTNCDGVIDLVGYSSTGTGSIDRYDIPQQRVLISALAREFVTTLQQGLISYPQIRVCS